VNAVPLSVLSVSSPGRMQRSVTAAAFSTTLELKYDSPRP
jgi:hypothetical protein